MWRCTRALVRLVDRRLRRRGGRPRVLFEASLLPSPRLDSARRGQQRRVAPRFLASRQKSRVSILMRLSRGSASLGELRASEARSSARPSRRTAAATTRRSARVFFRGVVRRHLPAPRPASAATSRRPPLPRRPATALPPQFPRDLDNAGGVASRRLLRGCPRPPSSRTARGAAVARDRAA